MHDREILRMRIECDAQIEAARLREVALQESINGCAQKVAEWQQRYKQLHEEVRLGVGDEFDDGKTIVSQLTSMRNEKARFSEMLALAANNTAAADLAQEVEFMRTKMQTASQAFAEWESVRTFRNDINSHEWLALVAAMTGLEHEQH